jgi:microcystin-dependent protein
MDPFIGQILMVGFNFAPKGWAMCNGQLLPIVTNQALFSLLGTMYGGDGRTNFALPNLQGRVPIHTGQIAGGSSYTVGASGGVENVTLLVNNLPSHSHSVSCSNAPGTSADPTNNVWAEVAVSGKTPHVYASSANAHMAGAAIGVTGANQPVANMQPYLCVNFIIALQGIFPSRD